MDKIVANSSSEVTVLLPAFNAEKYLLEAIESILNQSFTKFELLIIDDGSTDSTLSIINGFSDSRIQLVKHTENKGLIFTLNEGLKLAKSKYVVRMDADDEALPDRLKVQVDFMNMHPEIAAAGSYYQIVGKTGFQKMPIHNDAIKTHMLFHTAMAHPSMILRRDSFISNDYFFNEKFKHAEDYELWSRASVSLKYANVPEVLLKYRFHENQVSTKFNDIQRNSMNLAQSNFLLNIGIHPTIEEQKIQSGIAYSEYGNDKFYLNQLLSWLKKIELANAKANFFNQEALANYLSVKWFLISGHLALNGICPPVSSIKMNFNITNYVYIKNTFYLIAKMIIGQFKKMIR